MVNELPTEIKYSLVFDEIIDCPETSENDSKMQIIESDNESCLNETEDEDEVW